MYKLISISFWSSALKRILLAAAAAAAGKLFSTHHGTHSIGVRKKLISKFALLCW
jgi:hypothetical protein